MRQFKLTEKPVIEIPIPVLCQPTVSMNEEGHTTYIRWLLPITKIPLTPYQIRIKTDVEMSSPTRPPRTAACRVLKKILVETRTDPLLKSVLDRRGLFAPFSLNLDVNVHQRHCRRSYTRNAGGVAQSPRLDLCQLLR